MFETAKSALKEQGFETVFTQVERPEYSWLTVKSGARWVELMSFQDSDAIAYQLTDVAAKSVEPSEKSRAQNPE